MQLITLKIMACPLSPTSFFSFYVQTTNIFSDIPSKDFSLFERLTLCDCEEFTMFGAKLPLPHYFFDGTLRQILMHKSCETKPVQFPVNGYIHVYY